MSKLAYKHIFLLFGRKPGYIFAVFTQIVRTLVLGIWGVIIVANIANDLSVGDLEAAKSGVLLYFAVGLPAILLGGLGEMVGHHSENSVNQKMSKNFYDKLINKDMSFYRSSFAGYLSIVHEHYVDSSHVLARFLRTSVTQNIISLTIPVVILSTYSLKLGGIALLIVLVQIFYVSWATKKASPYRAIAHELYKRKNALIADDITNMAAYKAGGNSSASKKRIYSVIDATTTAFWKRRIIDASLEVPRSILTILLLCVGLWLAIDASQGQTNGVAIIVVTLTYMFQLQRSVGDVPDILGKLDDLITKVEPTLTILDDEYHETIRDGKTKIKSKLQGDIAFHSVSFTYADHGVKEPVFNGLSIAIPKQQKVGIVGLSGAGKSTLASLLLRFDDVTEGAITIDGYDIRDFSQNALRQNIAYVPQEPLLFHQTITDNIAYGNSSATEAEIKHAAKVAHADEFIEELPDQYNTIVGDRGVKLSGGQKQRIAIARALLKKAPILLFDEATSALDSESEEIIQAALPQIVKDQTAIIIAHRLSTVAHLDKIIVLDKGKIIEEGTHRQLLAKKGKYASLWKTQTSHRK